MKYKFIKTELNSYPVCLCCNLLGVSRAGYYHWQKRHVTQRRLEEKAVLEKIRKYYDLSHRRYGLLKIYRDIRKEGVIVNKKRIYRLMKLNNIYSKTVKKFKVTTKQSKGARFSPNLVNRNFHAAGENQVWTSDITYISTSEGWLYLAVVQDMFNREEIGWSIMQRPTADIVTNAINMAITNRRPGYGVIFHSDRGSQYTSSKVRNLLNRYKFKQSMSGNGNCYDNAITESFFSTLKKELVYLTKFRTREQARREIFEYIEIFYNRQRSHSSLGYLSPVEYRIKMKEEFNSRVA
ncbi:MAG: IS3 family transposase [Ignavibacteriaceae bacterium]|nr:IS3 family transposase [Ignavibacteriaceae bacterium]